MPETRFLIIGQGLAGTALAWRLWERGAAFVIADRDEPLTCSKIAAGLVTPITGMRLNLNWRFAELRDEAAAFYREVERRTNAPAPLYHERDQVRLFRDAAQRELFRSRLEDPVLAAQVMRVDWESGARTLLDTAVFDAPHGGFEQTGGGFLEAAAYLEASRRFFAAHDCWTSGEVKPADLRLEENGAVMWRDTALSAAIFCQGWEAARHPWFDWAPFQSARGSIVTARASESGLGGERRVVNGGGCWLLPRADGTLRAGPTYEPRFDPAHPHEAGLEKLEELRAKLSRWVKVPLLWEETRTAVRPIVKKAKLLMGRHPRWERIGFLNGLGSKGALRAPWAARLLLEHWLDGAALEAEVDVRQNF